MCYSSYVRCRGKMLRSSPTCSFCTFVYMHTHIDTFLWSVLAGGWVLLRRIEGIKGEGMSPTVLCRVNMHTKAVKLWGKQPKQWAQTCYKATDTIKNGRCMQSGFIVSSSGPFHIQISMWSINIKIVITAALNITFVAVLWDAVKCGICPYSPTSLSLPLHSFFPSLKRAPMALKVNVYRLTVRTTDFLLK